jgi:hypothetical protein
LLETKSKAPEGVLKELGGGRNGEPLTGNFFEVISNETKANDYQQPVVIYPENLIHELTFIATQATPSILGKHRIRNPKGQER